MKKENGKTGIVFDRDTSEPEAKLQKRKKKKKSITDGNSQNINNNNKTNQQSANDKVTNKQNSNSNTAGDQKNKINDGNINDQLDINKDAKNKEAEMLEQQRLKEEKEKKDKEKEDKERNDKMKEEKEKKDKEEKERNDKMKEEMNANDKEKEKKKKEDANNKENKDNRGRGKDKDNIDNKSNANDNSDNNSNSANNQNTKEKNQYKNNQKSNSLNAFNGNNYEDFNQHKEGQSDNNDKNNSNSKRASQSLIDNNNNNTNREEINRLEEQNQLSNREINNLKSTIDDLLLIKDQFDKHVCPVFDKEPYLMQIESMRSEIERKDKTIKSLTQTNKRQRQALESLSNQVNEKIEKLNYNALQKNHGQGQGQYQSRRDIDDNSLTDKKEHPLESALRVKEKELKNAIALIEILSKDNNQLKNSLDTYGEYQKKLQLIDISKAKDHEIVSLTNELALLKKQLEEHRKCLKSRSDSQANITMLKEEVKRNKKEIGMLRKKNSELLVGSMSHMSHYNLPQLPNQNLSQNQDKDNDPKENKSCNDFNSNTFNQMIKKNVRTKSMSPIPKNKNHLTKNINRNNIKNHTIREKNPLKNENLFNDMFSEEEKLILIKLFGDDERYELFVKKVIVLETAKNSIENKYKLIVKQLMDKISSLDEQIEYLNQKNKESESRLKIFQFQVNEYRQGKKVYQKKITEYQKTIQGFEEQVIENKKKIDILLKQIEEIKEQKIIFKESPRDVTENKSKETKEEDQEVEEGNNDDDEEEEVND